MNEIISENATEIMEPVVEVAAKASKKNVVIGFAAGLVTGVAGTKLVKAAHRKIKARKERKAEAKKHYINSEESDEDVIVIGTDN